MILRYDQDVERVVIVGVLIFVIWTVLVNPPKTQLPEGTQEAPHRVEHGLYRDDNAKDEQISLSDREGVHLGDLFLRDGRVLEPSEKPNSFATEWTSYRYLLDLSPDVGTWAGVYRGSRVSRLQYGLRLSPGRLLYRVVSPDLVVGEESAGLGFSLYTPALGPFWSHTGIGAWYVYPYDRDAKPDVVVGLTLALYPY